MTNYKDTPAPTSIEPEWLTTNEAADYMRITPAVLRNWTSNGRVPYYKIGTLNRYKKEELRELLLKNRRGGSYDN